MIAQIDAINTLVSQSPYIAAVIIVVVLFLRHMRADSQENRESRAEESKLSREAYTSGMTRIAQATEAHTQSINGISERVTDIKVEVTKLSSRSKDQ